MIRLPPQKILPIPGLPKSESLHLRIIIPHRCVPIRSSVQVQIHQLLQISAHDLIRVDEDHFFEVHGEEDV